MNPERRRLLRHLSAGALVAGGVSGLIRQALAMGKHPIVPGIHTMRGVVLVNGRPARPGEPVLRGDSVSTGADGHVVLVIERDAFLLRENTQAVFGTEALKQTLRLISGKILSVFARGEHRIQIPTATIGIRGTGAYLEAVEDERNYFCLCYGEAEVDSVGGQRATYSTTHHEVPRYLFRDRIVAAPMLNHTDDELIMLEALTGRYPPFYGKYADY